MMCVYRIYQLSVRGYMIFAFLTMQQISVRAEPEYKGKPLLLKAVECKPSLSEAFVLLIFKPLLKP